MKRMFVATALAAACVLSFAQTTPSAEEVGKQMRELGWLKPGAIASVAGKAEFKGSPTYTFLGEADTDKFLKLNGNPPVGHSYTIAPVQSNWFAILHFAPEGYIKFTKDIFPGDGRVSDRSTETFLATFMAEFREHIMRVLTVLPREAYAVRS